ncbi:hypothetical protein TBLA_0B09740 [Henningerozyma blattae CBS 6284]|uniref:non-specific serine/threonine protein kinase n=1 Tax=Henningerozyma blattae (strain ATCC 34711 / CBS 6284 / DSM 70876 / NBRC 10599 / NRRL Y-10934 / UCD 77-7) TaxID=1071380 RepID=I2H088_HENB6|nr:hypothetical protein TBLA_0B09740 [Tetrapisispora blattae CBS 6284]CCH59790.1 hypothetical protein TBLA_0B09740 [Tetrapisispora blattae CBS 6284]
MLSLTRLLQGSGGPTTSPASNTTATTVTTTTTTTTTTAPSTTAISDPTNNNPNKTASHTPTIATVSDSNTTNATTKAANTTAMMTTANSTVTATSTTSTSGNGIMNNRNFSNMSPQSINTHSNINYTNTNTTNIASPLSSSFLDVNNAHTASGRSIPSLSTIIPYAVPSSNSNSTSNMNNGNNAGIASKSGSYIASLNQCGHNQYSASLPNNIAAIDSNVISSPIVDSVEPRFVVSRHKLHARTNSHSNNYLNTHSNNNTHSLSRSSSLSSQLGSLFFSSGNYHSNNSPTNNYSYNNNQPTNLPSTLPTSIPKQPIRARQASFHSGSRQHSSSSSYNDQFLEHNNTNTNTNNSMGTSPQMEHTNNNTTINNNIKNQNTSQYQSPSKSIPVRPIQQNQSQLQHQSHSSMVDFKRFFRRTPSGSFSPGSYSKSIGSNTPTPRQGDDNSSTATNTTNTATTNGNNNSTIGGPTTATTNINIQLTNNSFSSSSNSSSLDFTPTSLNYNNNNNNTSASVSTNNFENLYNKDSNDNADLPFSKKYILTGQDLGQGAGGSVKLVKRIYDNQIFAVKNFRSKFTNENKRDYIKKITSEYCIGTTLKHPNIIKTIEIIYEIDTIWQVLEYCEFDLFAIVMSNKMSYDEVSCCFKQILTGIQYLHSIGLAHRDLKLDNCVINKDGIVKLIDFGAAVVFQYPFSKNLVEATGIVGSDPYLAPEVCIFAKYDPRPVDIWSAAIIFACMILKKFPWKLPKLKDNSFKLFCSGRDCDSLSALVTKTPNPPSYENIDESSSPNTGNSMNDGHSGSHSPAKPQSNNPSDPHNLNIGPQRLLHTLPEESQYIISKMIDLAPACRVNIDEIMNDDWIRNIDMCRINEESLELFAGSNHLHTIVDQSEAHIAGLERKKRIIAIKNIYYSHHYLAFI